MRCRRIHAVVAVGLALGAVSSCRRRSAPEPRASTPPPQADSGLAAAVEPITRLSLPISAYHATITTTSDDDVAYLLTSGAAYRLIPGREPAELPIDLGFGATATRASFIHWSRGGVAETPKAGGASRRLVALAARPQTFVASAAPAPASDSRIAWLERSGEGRFSLRALIGKKAITAYASPGSIDAIAMLDEWLFFVERPAGADWRIGRVRTGGGEATFTAARQGRAPSMLAAHGDIYYYDGNTYQVRRLSPDLQRERALASSFVCSPIAVSAHVYCAQVEGIFELRDGERPRRLVPGSVARVVTELAATPTRLLWVADAGADKLELLELPLAP